ncbi:hypothetical protein [Verrucomicrobium sp. BvORR106]|uniref:hypothetical protein n=1 Tax=Verrucomicrobium sp. BvORR106 TaxID=1403819 RepID=UPI00057003F8|nr:hypothetical protein [Verrucomicrobium sp. BvORR106]
MSGNTLNSNGQASLGCLATGLAFVLVWLPGAILFYATVSSEAVMWWFIGRFQGVMALAVGVAVVLGYFWGLVGVFKIVKAGLRAVLGGEMK